MFTQKRITLFLFAAIAAFMIPATSIASLTDAYNNLDQNNAYGGVGHAVGMGGFQDATQFTASSSGNLSGLNVGITQIYGAGATTVTLTLLSDNGGTLGSSLWSDTLTNQQISMYTELPNGDLTGGLSLSNLGGPMLSAGSTYWLQASADPSAMLSWGYADTNMGGTYATYNSTNNGGTGVWSYNTNATNGFATEVIVDQAQATPIPAAVWLLGSGLAGLIGFKKKYLG